MRPFILLFLAGSFLYGSVDHSLIPAIEKFEQVENLPLQKYSKRQWKEIASALERREERIRVVSYNVLFNRFDHNLAEENRWPNRLPRVVQLLKEMAPDILSVQELYPDQLEDLFPFLNESFGFYAKACDDGELNGIFYRKGRFELVDSQTISFERDPLSTELKISDNLTLVKLRDLQTGRLLAVLNTHLSFSKVEKRECQARVITEYAEILAQEMPTIFTGDLNTFPNWLDEEKLPFLDGDYIHRILAEGTLREAREISLLGHLGPLSTFTNRPGETAAFQATGTPGVFLDHIYVSKGITVLIHAVNPGQVEGHFPSDHLPILADILLN